MRVVEHSCWPLRRSRNASSLSFLPVLAPCSPRSARFIVFVSSRRKSVSPHKPSSPKEVADWARLQFYAEVSKSDASLSLAKACMLVALEEEAAVAAEEQQRRLGLDEMGREEALTISQMRSRGSSRAPVLKREIGGESTWSLQRLDAMAAEAAALFAARCSPHAPPFNCSVLPAPDLKPKPRRGSAGDASSSKGSSALERTSACSKGLAEPSSAPPDSECSPSNTSSALSRTPPGPSSSAAEPGRNLPSSNSSTSSSKSSISSSVSSAGPDVPVKPSRRRRARAAAKPEQAQGTAGNRSEAAMKEKAAPRRKLEIGLLPERRGRGPSGVNSIAAGGADKRGGRAAEAMCSFPMQALSAVNDVLFLRHGYKRMDRHGDPRDSQLSQVLERGSGGAAALAILYMEVCQRMGLRMAARPLEGGRFFVLWPVDAPLRSCGCEFVIDAYSQGETFLLDEICAVFQHEGPTAELLQPASKKEILAALLGGLRDTHWARAVGCLPEPSLMLPISCATALGADGKPMVSGVSGLDMERAIAAAERRSYLLPDCRETQLELALLYYFASAYKDAWEELRMMLDGGETACADAQVAVFRQKLALLRSLDSL